MTCGHDELFARYVVGELDDPDAAEARRTIESCDTCRRRLENSAAVEEPGVASASGLGARTRALGFGLCAAAVVASIVALVAYLAARGGETEPPVVEERSSQPTVPAVGTTTSRTSVTSATWRDLKVAKAPYSPPPVAAQPVARDAGESRPVRPRETPFDRAMRPYVRNDFVAAATSLSPLARGGDARASFYLGVSLLLADRADEAVAPLTQAVEGTRGQFAGQANYYLAAALLRTYRFEEALRALKAAQDTGGPFAAKAAELEEEVRTSAL
jgi:hypothetical protein